MKVDYLMRSLMFVPGHNDRLMTSASKCLADVLLLDLEDSVLPFENKQVARDKIIEYVTAGKFSKSKVFPRINGRDSGELLKDIYQLTLPNGIEGFLYPKITCGEDIVFLDRLLEAIEYEKQLPIGKFKIIALIETAGAVMHLDEICNASPNRIVALAFGCEDYVSDMNGKHDKEGQSIFVARTLIATCARAHNIVPIDTVHINVHDLADLEDNLILSKKIGFSGMLILNPKELPLCHQYYSPSKEEVDWAEEMLQLSQEAIDAGKGVAVKDNKFIGPPMVRMAEDILAIQKMIDNKQNSI